MKAARTSLLNIHQHKIIYKLMMLYASQQNRVAEQSSDFIAV